VTLYSPRFVSVVVGLALVVSGCFSDTDDKVSPRGSSPFPTGAFGESRLLFDSECPDLLANIKSLALTEVTPWGLDGFYGIARDFAAGEPVMLESTVEESAVADSGDFSETNTQEAGVDEGDVIETDGKWIYYARSSSVDVVDPVTLETVSSTSLPDGTHHMVLHGGRLAVVSSSWSSWDTSYYRLFEVSPDGSLDEVSKTTLEGRTIGVRSVGGQLRILLETLKSPEPLKL
jgi:uncharacterized secreted protein with C-terminal beta-propeller domain